MMDTPKVASSVSKIQVGKRAELMVTRMVSMMVSHLVSMLAVHLAYKRGWSWVGRMVFLKVL